MPVQPPALALPPPPGGGGQSCLRTEQRATADGDRHAVVEASQRPDQDRPRGDVVLIVCRFASPHWCSCFRARFCRDRTRPHSPGRRDAAQVRMQKEGDLTDQGIWLGRHGRRSRRKGHLGPGDQQRGQVVKEPFGHRAGDPAGGADLHPGRASAAGRPEHAVRRGRYRVTHAVGCHRHRFTCWWQCWDTVETSTKTVLSLPRGGPSDTPGGAGRGGVSG